MVLTFGSILEWAAVATALSGCWKSAQIPYRMCSLKAWADGSFPKKTTNGDCVTNLFDTGLAILGCSETIQAFWMEEVSHACTWYSLLFAGCSGSGAHNQWEEPRWALPSNWLQFCSVCSVVYSRDGDGQLPRGHHSESGILLCVRGAVDEVWLPPAWFHHYPPDQQMELREYCFLKANKIVYPQFTLLRVWAACLLLLFSSSSLTRLRALKFGLSSLLFLFIFVSFAFLC